MFVEHKHCLAVSSPRVARGMRRVLAALLLACSAPAWAGQINLAWDPTANASGYRVFYGTSSGTYSANIDVGSKTSASVAGLTDGARYYFAVKAYDTVGMSSYSNEVNAVVPVAAPAASFSANPTSGTAPLTVTLSDGSSGSITSRSWSFGDGTTATTQTVAKTFANPGSYNVTLTVANSTGSTSATKTIVVTAAAPVASFSATPVSGSAPLPVKFNDSSTGTVTGWSWEFGDGGKSTAQNPSYTYAIAGTYAVKLTVTGPGGSNTQTKTSFVTVAAPSTGAGGGTSSGSTSSVANGLVAAYGFEEASGTQVIDASGNLNHGTLSGAVRVNMKSFGKALKFNGVDNLVTVEDSASLDLTKGMTVMAWVHPTAWLSNWATVVFKEQSDGAAYHLQTDPSGLATTAVGWNARLSAGSRLPANVWTHVAATYDGLNQRLFVNGVQVGSRPQSGAIPISSGKLRLGGNTIWGEYFTGYIDEVRVYNRALSEAEIAADSKRAVVNLMMSASPDRSKAKPLNGLSVSGNVYVFYTHISPTAATNGVREVRFWLDDPTPHNPTGPVRTTEGVAPYDLAGTLHDGTAAALNTSGMSKGRHTVTAQVVLNDGTVLPYMAATFDVP